MSRKNKKNPLKIILVSITVVLIISALIFLIKQNDSTNINRNASSEKTTQAKIQKIESVVENYHNTHTYSGIDFFVCTDSAIDVWNLIKTEGINAQICAGNVDEDLRQYLNKTQISLEDVNNYLRYMDHAWVIAEAEPFTWLALETTGGYVAWGANKTSGKRIENDLYYKGICFDSPAEFKKFTELRDEYFEICEESEELTEEWNINYSRKELTSEDYVFKGKVDSKEEECQKAFNQLVGILS